MHAGRVGIAADPGVEAQQRGRLLNVQRHALRHAGLDVQQQEFAAQLFLGHDLCRGLAHASGADNRDFVHNNPRLLKGLKAVPVD